jgi:hypothetical protein
LRLCGASGYGFVLSGAIFAVSIALRGARTP